MPAKQYSVMLEQDQRESLDRSDLYRKPSIRPKTHACENLAESG